MKYIAYCRKSTDEKDKQVLSIDQQIAELKEFASCEHLEVIDFVTEAKTAKIPGRKQFEILLKRIEKGEAQGIVSWHPDRLARNSVDGGKIIYLLDTGKLLDLKFPSFWFESTPQGKFMLNIAFGQSKYYVDSLSENVRRGMKHKIRIGIWPMKAPYGYKNDTSNKTIQIDSEFSKVIKRGFEMFSEGGKSFTEIAKYMHSLGVPKSKNRFKSDTVKRILMNRFYIGIMKYDGEYFDGSHKTFIPKELFDKVQKQVDQIERPRKNGHDFVFSGLARCGECNAAITAEQHIKRYKNGNQQRFIYYRCTKKLKPCPQKYLNEQNFIEQVREIISKCAIHESWQEPIEKWMETESTKDQLEAETTIQTLKQELKMLDEKLSRLLDTYLDQIIDALTYKIKKNELFEEKLRLEEKIAKMQNGGSSWLEPMKEWLGSALTCAKIARAKNTDEDLGNLVKTVGSNFYLLNRRLAVNLKFPFAALQTPPPVWSQPFTGLWKTCHVSRLGFEPRTNTLKGYCSTVELPAHA